MIYPIPQKNNLKGKKISAKSVSLQGDCKELFEKVFGEYEINTNGGINVTLTKEDTRQTTYAEEISALTDEKYLITAGEELQVKFSSEKGAFRCAHTLARLIKNDELKEGTLEDYPLFKTRGYIEGFYGPTWSDEKRRSVLRLMASYGMNTFFYAPKDDLYHREKWRELYPEKELEELKNLFLLAEENYMSFHWAVGPGLTYKYTSEEDFALLMDKFKSIYDIGVRNFGLLLDDIPWEFQYEEDEKAFDGVVDAHIYLVNKAYNALKELDPSIKVTVCPTQYSGEPNQYYVTKFGSNIPCDVDMFWTGAEICSRVLTVREADELANATNHKPLYWDNYPVNDCEMYHEMHMSAIIGRDKELYKHCAGLISNVMEYAECSKIPLLTIADYLWNPLSYNPEGSLANAHKEILGDDAESFAYFADHLGVSCLSKYSSALMSRTLARVSFLESRGDKAAALEFFNEYILNMKKCFALVSNTQVPLFCELQKWVKKFGMCCDLLEAIYNVKSQATQKNVEALREKLEKYNSDAVILTGFCLREMAEKTLEKAK